MKELFIKNMVCNRCIMVVKEELAGLGLQVQHIGLGKVELEKTPDQAQLSIIRQRLEQNGFELLDDKRSKLVNQIKSLIIRLVHYSSDSSPGMNLSDYLAREIGMDYSYLSSLFSAVENTTIEKYLISQKIERVKELLIYNELTLSEISYQMGYSSVQYLSSQFKKVTGLTPGYFKQLKENRRRRLDEL